VTDGFCLRLDHGPGIRVAVKDLIDLAGQPTTAGSAAVPLRLAERDAACLSGVRRDATIVGKTALHELAYGITGVNPWQGTPTNPLDAALVPGGSSSGAAVVVANGEADVALGSDTGGSIRIPAAWPGSRPPTAGSTWRVCGHSHRRSTPSGRSPGMCPVW